MSEDEEVQSEPVTEGAGAGVGGRTRGSKAVIAVVIVLVILAAVAVYARGGFGGADTSQEPEGDGIVEETSGGTVIDDGAGFEVEAPEGAVKEFEITGHNFAFSDNTIRVKKGDTVKLAFRSTDGFHDWTSDAFDAKTERVNTGDSSIVIFTADTVGEFPFYCSVGSHRSLGMEGMLIVEE